MIFIALFWYEMFHICSCSSYKGICIATISFSFRESNGWLAISLNSSGISSAANLSVIHIEVTPLLVSIKKIHHHHV